MNLSKNFSFHEGMHSNTAIRLGIDNTPKSDELIENMKVAARGMQEVRKTLGNHPITVDSWYRCEALERVLCANDFMRWCGAHGYPPANEVSWHAYYIRKGHPKGFAVDFVCYGFGTPLEIVKAIVNAGIKFDQLVMEGTWVHISFDPQMRGEILTATFKNGVPHYKHGL